MNILLFFKNNNLLNEEQLKIYFKNLKTLKK
jgi:hypothetical protein